MAVIEKSIIEWKRIMLDTSIVLSLFLSENPKNIDQRVVFIRKLIDYLDSTNSGDNQKRTFLVSSIAVTEMLTKENDQEKIKKILRVLNSGNVEFIDFDLNTALMFNYHLYPHLSKTTLHEYAKQFGFKTNEYMMAREWINRDFMIVMAGLRHNADVVLTADVKTFYPLAEKSNAFCALAYPRFFDQSKMHILGYKHKDAQQELLGLPKTITKKLVPDVSHKPKIDSNGSE